ncbi:hypothetical protein RJ640_017028 [Escallonia rubra]|uniref:Uncharacterized protein n=1 Tax=Escallonia rubra TaxID=112253 RepID=A0AA88R1E2_9ASTE|nr:hypothetical protein RJ640_017028 [Escallonia rubra]
MAATSGSSRSAITKYPYPCNIGAASYVWLELDHRNHRQWKIHMLSFLENQNMVGFVNGDQHPPSREIDAPDGKGKIRNPDFDAWSRSDGLVKSWILSTVSEAVRDSVKGLVSSRDVWEKICFRLPRDAESENVWILDTSASGHFTYDKNLLHNIIQDDNPVYVDAGTEEFLFVKNCSGDACLPNLRHKLMLHDVLFVPTSHENLISIKRLTSDYPCYFVFTSTGYVMKSSLKTDMGLCEDIRNLVFRLHKLNLDFLLGNALMDEMISCIDVLTSIMKA